MNSTYKPASWDLSEILPEDYNRQLRGINSLVRRFEGEFKGRLRCNISEERLLRALDLLNRIEESHDKLVAGYSLLISENPNDAEVANILSNLQRFRVEMDNRTLFFDSWVQNDVKAKGLQRIMNRSGKYGKYLKGLYDERVYALDDDVEKMTNYKDLSGSSLIDSVYEMLTSKMRFEIELDGKTRVLGLERLHELRHNPRADVRTRVYELICNRFGETYPVFGELFIAMAKGMYNENVTMRGHKSVISKTEYQDDVPKGTIDMIVDASMNNKHVFDRYFNLKKVVCEVNEPFSFQDIRAPVRNPSKELSYDWAMNAVLESLCAFSGGMRERAEELAKKNHVNALPKEGASGPSYCMCMADGVMPFIRINYESNAYSLASLAHEMGHALHGIISSEHVPFLLSDAPNPLCETASTFSEMILVDSLLSRNDISKELKQELLVNELNSNYIYVIDCAYGTAFEKESSRVINSRKGANAKHITDIFLRNMRSMGGNSVHVPDYMRYYWVNDGSVIITPFYNYSYIFGQLVSLALYEQYRQQGREFVPKYERLLSLGSSKSADDMLREFGINIRSRAFWDSCFGIINKRINVLESLIQP